jgi:pimeloyl-ACP methyl ester carboxylesterase
VAEQVFMDICRWTAAPRGGHFVALEQPHLQDEEIRAFFRLLQ